MKRAHPLVLREWLADHVFTRLLKNASLMFGGNVTAALLGLASVSLTARGLGPAVFGTLVVIRAYALLVDRLVNFQSWQALIRYGAEALEQRRHESFKQLVLFSVLLDLCTAAAATLLAILGLRWAAQWQQWDAATVWLAGWYSLSLLFNVSGVAKGVLRLFDRFKLFAVQQAVCAVVKLVGVVLVVWSHGGLRAFLVVWMVTDILGYLVLFGLAWRELARRGLAGMPSWTSFREVKAQYPHLWRFVWMTNMNLSVRQALKEADTLVVGGMLGSAAAGLYHVAKQCVKLIDQFADPLDEVVYPELARSWARGDVRTMKRLIVRIGLTACSIAGLIWLGWVVFGGLAIHLLFGAAFVGAKPVLIWYMLGLVIATVTFPMDGALLAAGQAPLLLLLNFTGTLVYFGSLVPLLKYVGLPGAGVAHIVQQVWLFTVFTVAVFQLLRAAPPAHAVPLRAVPVGKELLP